MHLQPEISRLVSAGSGHLPACLGIAPRLQPVREIPPVNRRISSPCGQIGLALIRTRDDNTLRLSGKRRLYTPDNLQQLRTKPAIDQLFRPNRTMESKHGKISRGLGRALRTVLFIDIVESARLIERHEEATVHQWLDISRHIKEKILPSHSGRIVKTTGDGLLIEFVETLAAIRTALAVQKEDNRRNARLPLQRQMRLRMGLEVTELIVGEDDVYGHGVNVAARLMALAGPSEIIASARVRDQCIPGLDADIEDLGIPYLKNITKPVRAYRIGPPGPRLHTPPITASGELLPSVAVLPFAPRGALPGHPTYGDILAEEVIRSLSQSPNFNVISRLSTNALRGRVVSLDEVAMHLKANYVLSGFCVHDASQVSVDIELADTTSGKILWSERLNDTVARNISENSGILEELVRRTSSRIMANEMLKARSFALPTLASYTLFMGALTLMHRMSLHDFKEARVMLETLSERAPRQSAPHAWIAKWHVLKSMQGWSDNPDREASLAHESTKRALDCDPDSSLALAIDGLVHTHMLKKLDVAQDRYERALECNPSDSMAWLLRGALHAFIDEGAIAVTHATRALKLTPLDPHKYYYDSIAATAHITAGNYQQAHDLARQSLRANRAHTSTLRVLTVAQWQLGQEDEARETAKTLLEKEPGLTVSGYLRRTPSASFKVGRMIADILKKAGVPG